MAGRLVLADNLTFLATLPDSSVDLVYADPPFGTQRTRRLASLTRAPTFEDVWDGGVRGYVEWMRPRLQELHRVLRSTGSLFLHADWRASHRLRVELDELFGVECFRNEIVWHYGLGGRAPANAFARKHDTILFYARSAAARFNPTRGDVTPAMAAKYAHQDEEGRRFMRSYGRRYYLKGGKRHDSVWQIPAIAPGARERLGYPTQKPEALLERIVEAASDPGDLVLDPFLGSGTTAVVALRLGREFVGCDRSADAIALTRARVEAFCPGLVSTGGDL
jgi:site-specific DNA-methyltransferase (adenine-specific)